jgi:hypothetical protein
MVDGLDPRLPLKVKEPAFMNWMICTALAFVLGSVNSSQGPGGSPAKEPSLKGTLIHFAVINMSGKSREVHLRDGVIGLPVAQRVSLQAPVGGVIEITSDTNQKIKRIIVIDGVDQGRIIPID